MYWNNTMLVPEWALALEIAQNVAMLGMAAFLLTRLSAFKRTLRHSEYRKRDKLLLGLIFGLFSAVGNWIGIPIHGAIANSRIVGAIAGGLIGGPLVGLMAGCIGALARFYMGGFTVWPSVLSNIIVGLLAGLIAQRLGSQRITVRRAFFIALLGEGILKAMILLLAKPFEAAWKLEQAIALPTMIGNSLAVAFFIYIVHNVVNEQQHMQAYSVQQAIRMIRQTGDIFQRGLNEQSAYRVALIIWNEMRPAATAITDTKKVLAFIGEGEDHHQRATEIATEATKLALSTKRTVIVNSREEIGCPHPSCPLSAVIDAPIIVLGELAGTIKVYKTGNETITPYEAQLVQGIADSIGSQLTQQCYEQQQLALLQTEYSMLRAQINPHFFYNTLSTIQSLVRKDEAAVSLIKDVADFFRYTLKRGDELVAIREELAVVDRYFRIEKARFRDRVTLNVEVPEALLDMAIPSFTLQPLVENAVRHGISVKRGGGRVVIAATLAGGSLAVTVSDDGVGMTPERLQQVRNSKEGLATHTGTGIALDNVDRRIRTLCGENCGLSISSEAGAGTTVTLTLPVRKAGNGHAETS